MLKVYIRFELILYYTFLVSLFKFMRNLLKLVSTRHGSCHVKDLDHLLLFK